VAEMIRTSGEVDLYIDAPADAVYRRIADVTRTGDRSVECRSCEWLPGSTPGAVGARFRGRNRSGMIRWSRKCEVVAAEPGRRFAFRTVPERFDPTRADSTTWSYALEPEGEGTRVRHAYEITKWPVRPLQWLYARMLPQHRDMRPQMAHTLEALRAEVESPPGTPEART
jgi:Polyketide cyclase / dehydrase and lipid transport